MKTVLLLFSLFVFVLPAFAQKTPTNLVVRAKAKDAKFIGSSIGGAFITVKNDLTGELLASGYTQGSTGNTSRIMQDCHERTTRLSDEATAGFSTTLDLDAPLKVTIAALAPAAHAQAAVLAQTQVWLIPGKHIEGDGIVLEIPGFIVDVLTPQTHEVISGLQKLTLRANVVMMCGCPVTEGGMWNAAEYEVKGLVMKNGEKVDEFPLSITEKTSTFAGEWQPDGEGSYEIIVYAYDDRTGNTGLDRATFIIRE